MGCGKSSIGRELAALLNCPAIDLDEMVERLSGLRISEIFETEGEAGFRRLELEALREVLEAGGDSENLILSLGGGTLTTPECAKLIHEKTVCIYLRATIDTLAENLEEDGVENRPILKGTRSQNSEHSPIEPEQSTQQRNSQQNGENCNDITLRERIAELMGARKDSYEKTAHYMIDIDGETPRETAERIAVLLG